VEIGVNADAARKDERAKRLERLVHLINLGFEPLAVGIGDAGLAGVNVFGQGGEDGAGVEEFMLHAEEDGGQRREPFIGTGGLAGKADGGIEFIDGAVGFHSQVVLEEALTAN
jgi:hypothetical protein